MSGYKIEFESYPYQSKIPQQISFGPVEKQVVNAEIESLLQKGATVESSPESGEYISNFFVVPKGSSGLYCPVINLKHLNKSVKYEHFKQEHFSIF